LALGQSDDALAAFRALAEAVPADASALMRLGAAARAGGRLQIAREAFERALFLDPDLLAARVELGDLCLAQQEYDEAIDHARAALDALPGYTEAALIVAEAERARGQPDAAVTVLADLLADDPYHFPALLRLGEILLAEGRLPDARQAILRVLRFEPESARAWIALGDLAAGEGQRRHAVKCWRNALEARPDPIVSAAARERLANAEGSDPLRRSA
jgi:tetratricopeptide (TPR) repeat protein